MTKGIGMHRYDNGITEKREGFLFLEASITRKPCMLWLIGDRSWTSDDSSNDDHANNDDEGA